VRGLVIAKSGDLAHKFGVFVITFGPADNTHFSFFTFYLRISRIIGAEWMVGASLVRPNNEEKLRNKNEAKSRQAMRGKFSFAPKFSLLQEIAL
jgi:hypothetical protein